jgi:hypothetical protein
MTRVYLLIHVGCLCLLGEVLTSPLAPIRESSAFGRFIGISRHPWVLVNPLDLWARRSALFAAEAILDPRFSIDVHIISSRAMVIKFELILKNIYIQTIRRYDFHNYTFK